MGKFEDEKIKKREYKELPYTTVAHTILLPAFSITLTADGLKKLVEDCHDKDLVHITIRNGKRTKFEISKYITENEERS